MANYSKNEAQEWAWENLKGQWTTLVTPFDSNNKIDEIGLRKNITYTQSLGTKGAGCTWGMGEFWSLSQNERKTVMDITSDESRSNWLIGSHISHTSMVDMLDLADHAQSTGFDLLIVAAPYMVARTEEQVIEWVSTLASHTNLAIMFYNSPQFNIVMSPQGLNKLCQIPNVVGVKEASFSQQTSIETHLLVGKKAIISTPDEWIYRKAESLGFKQQVMFANTSDWRFDTPNNNNYVKFIDKASEGNIDWNFYDKNIKAIKDVSDKWWGYTVKKFGGALPLTLVKYWGELMGMASGGVRQPFSELTESEKEQIKSDISSVISLNNIPNKTQTNLAGELSSNVYTTDLIAKNGNGHKNSNGHKNGLGSFSDARPTGFDSGMMLMVSVQDVKEALEAEKGGADVVDVKNLQEAMVGSGHPLIVKEVREIIPDEKHVSVTLGVVPNQPGTVAMATHAAASLKATSVKVGFIKADYETALDVLKEAKKALEGTETKLIGSLFADNVLYEEGLDPECMVTLAKESGCDGWLIDTLTKDGRNLFDFIPEAKLREMVFESKKLGLSTALSGHLKLTDLDELARINPDIVGVRGAVCSTGDRDRAVAWEAVAKFKSELDKRKSGEIEVHDKPSTNSEEWNIIDGRGKTCAGVLAALTNQISENPYSYVEAILADALNIYDVIVWAEEGNHEVVTKRTDADGSVRVLFKPNAMRLKESSK